MFYQFNASVQYQIGADLLLEAAYVGTRGLNLFRQIAINQARLASAANPTLNPARRGDYHEHASEMPCNVRLFKVLISTASFGTSPRLSQAIIPCRPA
jgi:hypothetical protein